MAFSPYLSHVSPGMGLVPAELLPNTPVLVSGNPTVTVPGGSAGQKLMRTDKLEVFGLSDLMLFDGGEGDRHQQTLAVPACDPNG